MNKKEILDILDNAKDEKGSVPMRLVRQAFDKLPTIQPVATDINVGDMISRQAAIDEIDEWIKAFRENGHKESAADVCLIQDGIIQLPSAQPERKKGAWINEGRIIRCNRCKIGYAAVKGMKSALTYKFCPNCGADMRGEQG